MKDETIEAEIIEDEFLAPVQVTARELKTLVNVDELIKKHKKLANTPLDTNIEKLGVLFLELQAARKDFTNGRTKLEKEAKALRDPFNAFAKLVIKIEKEVQLKLNPYETKLRALTDKVENEEARKQQEAEEAEEARVYKIKDNILLVKNMPLQHYNSSSKELTNALESLVIVTKEKYEEFYEEALENQNLVISQLQTARSNKFVVENAQKIQDEADRKALVEKEKEEKEHQIKKDALAKEQADFDKKIKDFEDIQRAIQDEADRKIAEEEAEELLKKQAIEKKEREEKRSENYDRCFDDVFEFIKDYNSMYELTKDLCSGEVPHMKFEVHDGN